MTMVMTLMKIIMVESENQMLLLIYYTVTGSRLSK